MRRVVRLSGAAIALLAAALLVVLALDVRAWQQRIAADDLAYRTAPARGELWEPTERAPFGLARRMLSLDDDLRYREAARLFRLGKPREEIFLTSDVAILQAQAQGVLGEVAAAEEDATRVARASNLLGVLAFALARRDPALEQAMIDEGLRRFRAAIRHDPTSADSKFNLELALASIQGRPASNPENRAGGRGRARGTASLGDEAGEGY